MTNTNKSSYKTLCSRKILRFTPETKTRNLLKTNIKLRNTKHVAYAADSLLENDILWMGDEMD